jgi:hypothetical protein
VEIFGANQAGHIWHRISAPGDPTAWSLWMEFGNVGGKVTAETNPDGSAEVFAIDSLGRLIHRRQTPPSGPWSAWEQIGGGVNLTSIAAARNADGSMLLIAADHDLRVIQRRRPAGSTTWGDWQPLDGRMTQLSARANRNALVEVVGVDHAGQVWRRRQTATGTFAGSAWSRIASGSLRPDVPVPVPGSTVGNPPPQAVVIPNVISEPVDTATATLTGLGLVVTTSKVFDCVDPDSVANQHPGSGAVVPKGSTIDLGVHQHTKSDGKPCTVEK